MHEARQPAGGLVRDPREEGQADEPELGARPKRHEERQMGHRQDEDAHREYVEVGHLQEPLVAAGLEEARLGAEVVLDDRPVAQAHLVEVQERVGDPQGGAVEQERDDDQAEQRVSLPLTSDREPHQRVFGAIIT